MMPTFVVKSDQLFRCQVSPAPDLRQPLFTWTETSKATDARKAASALRLFLASFD